jgi:hypothetical protein
MGNSMADTPADRKFGSVITALLCALLFMVMMLGCGGLDRHYVLTHHCDVLNHYGPVGARFGFFTVHFSGLTSFRCDDVIVDVGDVNGKPWRP